MTTPDVEQELERLFSVTRAATAPDAGARERIRASISPRLAASAAKTLPAWALGLGLGVTVLGACAGVLWLTGARPDQNVHAPSATPVLTSPALVVAPSALPATDSLTKREPAPEASRPIPSVRRNAEPAAELALVRQMQQALRSGNPGQALALAGDHTRRFPRGTLVEEREGVRAVARCQLAAAAARPAISSSFTQRFASSPYAARVKAACQ